VTLSAITTWPTNERDLPATSPVGGVLRYDEGLSIGYRRSGASPLYPFGHGLGWATWAYASVDASKEVSARMDVPVEVRLSDTGSRRSREVVQVYASRSDSGIERPVRWLAAFAAVEAEPGERRRPQ
jgi:beta-glucosidase